MILVWYLKRYKEQTYKTDERWETERKDIGTVNKYKTKQN
jgi:hypothetical protein